MTEPAIFAICLIQYPTPLASSSNGFLYSRASAFGVLQDAIMITLITFQFSTTYREIVVCSRLWWLYELLCQR